MEFQACITGLSDFTEGAKAAADFLLKPVQEVVNKPTVATVKFLWNFVGGLVTSIAKTPVHIINGDTSKLGDDWKNVAMAPVDLVLDVAAPAARVTGAVLSGGVSEITIAAVELAKTGAKAFSASDSKALACLLAAQYSDDDDFTSLIYLLNHKELYGLVLEEPSVTALTAQLMKKYGEVNKDTPANSIANVLSAAVSIAGLGGLDFAVLLPENELSATAITTAVNAAKTGVLKWANAHPEEKTPLQRRIGRYLSEGIALPYRPTDDTPRLLVQLAGLTLGQYYCQAAKHYGHVIEDISCSELDRVFSTVLKMGDAWKNAQFNNLGMIEKKGSVHRLKDKLKRRARLL